MTERERRGRELFGCEYNFLPFDQLDWEALYLVRRNIFDQLSLFYQYVSSALFPSVYLYIWLQDS